MINVTICYIGDSFVFDWFARTGGSVYENQSIGRSIGSGIHACSFFFHAAGNGAGERADNPENL